MSQTRWCEPAPRRRARAVGLLMAALCCLGGALPRPAAAQGPPDIVWRASGHAGSVESVAVSPDGQTLASASVDNTIKLWEVVTGKLLRTIVRLDRVQTVAFSPDGLTLASGGTGFTGEDTIALWRVSDGILLRTFTGYRSTVYSVAFSPDGRTLASASEDRTVKLWDAANGTLLYTLAGHTDVVRSVAFNGLVVASGSWDRTVKLWNAADGTLLRTLTGTATANSVAFAPDGQTLASGNSDRTVKLWEVATGTLLRTLVADATALSVRAVAFSPDGQTLTAGNDNRSIRLWRPQDGTLLHVLGPGSTYVASVYFSLDGQTVLSAEGRFVKQSSLVDGTWLRNLVQEQLIGAVAFSPDGQTLAYVTGSPARTIKLWSIANETLLHTLTGHTTTIQTLAFSPDGQTLASGADYPSNSILLWNVTTGTLLRTLSGGGGNVASIAFSPDGQLLATTSDNTVRLIRMSDRALLHTFAGHQYIIYAVAFSPDGQTLASAGQDRTIRLWSVPNRTLLHTLTGHSNLGVSIAFSPDSRTLISGGDSNSPPRRGEVRLWRVADGAALQTYDQETGSEMLSVAFSPDGRLFGYGTSGATGALVVARTPNRAPAVSLLSPGANAHFTKPAMIALSAGASDSDGTVVKVEFFAYSPRSGNVKIGEDTSAPYNITWSNPSIGRYQITAVATDNLGATTVSSPITVTVTRTK